VVRGAKPGDVVAIDLIELTPFGTGKSAILRDFGVLRREFPEPMAVSSEVREGRSLRFVPDSALEGNGFELSVPRARDQGFYPGTLQVRGERDSESEWAILPASRSAGQS
jgi:hypothetical protein